MKALYGLGLIIFIIGFIGWIYYIIKGIIKLKNKEDIETQKMLLSTIVLNIGNLIIQIISKLM